MKTVTDRRSGQVRGREPTNPAKRQDTYKPLTAALAEHITKGREK